METTIHLAAEDDGGDAIDAFIVMIYFPYDGKSLSFVFNSVVVADAAICVYGSSIKA